MKNLVPCIDVSKEKPDLCLHSDGQPVSERAVENSTPAIRSSLQGVLKCYGKEASEVLICAEYTGQYAYPQGCARKELHTGLWMENTAPIKHPSGLVRRKNDKPDARKIAACAVRLQDKVHLFSLPEKKPTGLKQLSANVVCIWATGVNIRDSLPAKKRFMDTDDCQDKTRRMDRVLKEPEMAVDEIDSKN
jgi:hypothetical protein